MSAWRSPLLYSVIRPPIEGIVSLHKQSPALFSPRPDKINISHISNPHKLEPGQHSRQENARNSPVPLPPRLKVLRTQLQKRFPHEPAPHVIHRGRQARLTIRGPDGLEGAGHAGGVADVGADAHGVAAGGLDLRDDGLEVAGVAGEKDDWVGGGELEGAGAACGGEIQWWVRGLV